MRAYGVPRYQINGPDWLDTETYEVIGTIPPGVSRLYIPEMLQELLAERFHLVVHREMRNVDALRLMVGSGGLRLEPCKDEACPRTSTTFVASTSAKPVRLLGARIQTSNMQRLAEQLSRALKRPVFDGTGVEGEFRIILPEKEEYFATPNVVISGTDSDLDSVETSPAGVPSVFAALKQAGLRLASHHGSLEFVIVDRADRSPSAQ